MTMNDVVRQRRTDAPSAHSEPGGFGLLSPQIASWLDIRLLPDGPAYTTGKALFFDIAVDADILAGAATLTVAETEVLRVRITLTDGVLRQIPQPAWPVDLAVADFSSAADPEAAARLWMEADIRRGFRWDAFPLFRFALLRLGPARSVVFQTFHHMILDAMSGMVLMARISQHYAAIRDGTAPPPWTATPYAEVVAEEARYLASARAQKDREHWLSRLADLPEPPAGADRRRSERGRSGRPSRIGIVLPAATYDALRQAAAARRTTPSRAMLTLVHVAFARLTGHWDLVSGVAIGMRGGTRFRNTIGLLARNMPFRLALSPDVTLAEAIGQVHGQLNRDYPRLRYPAHALHQALGVAHRGHPLFDVEVNYLTFERDLECAGSAGRLELLSHGFILPWLVTILDHGPGQAARLTLDTDPGLVSRAEAEAMGACLRVLIEAVGTHADTRIGNVPVMDSAAVETLRQLAADAPVGVQAPSLVTLVEAQARRTPGAPALIWGEAEFTHAVLQERSSLLARQLTALGVGRGAVVALALPRTPDLVVAVLAVHKAGAAYVPIDPSYPAQRIAWMLDDAAAALVLTSEAMAESFAGFGTPLIRLDVAADLPAPAADVPPAPGPDDLAYVLYTSGSTGRPKAVGVMHRNAVNLASWGGWLLGAAERAGLLFATSTNFDLSIFEMFVPLACGGCLILVDGLLDLPIAPRRADVRVINTSPSLFAALLATGGLPATVRTVILAGEALPRTLCDRLIAANPGVRLINAYGPTETTVYATWTEVDPRALGPPPIGRGIWNTSLRVLDPGGVPVPPGISGELWIGGAGVARGYLNRPELTAERFVTDATGRERRYRTGDRVRWRGDGQLEFLGRCDDQFKINAVRIEPGEIESALLGVPGVAQAVVVLRTDRNGTERLIAWLVAERGATRPFVQALRAAVAAELPTIMVPTFFAWCDALPLTPTGKVDRRALPAPEDEAAAVAPTRPPETPAEQRVAAVWREVMRADVDCAEADFFALGGDSLEAITMFSLLEQRFGVRVSGHLLAGDLTVARLAAHIEAAGVGDEAVELVELQPLGAWPPFICVPGLGGDVMHLRPLAGHVCGARPFFALRYQATADDPAVNSVAAIAARCVTAVLRRQPRGPFLLGSYSGGAPVAYEMARQLTAAGHEVALLAIIDAERPGWRADWRDAPRVALGFAAAAVAGLRGRFDAAGRGRLRYDARLEWRVWRGGLHPASRVVDLDRFPRQMRRAMERHYGLLTAYCAQPWSGRITLLRTRPRPLVRRRDECALGWSGVARAGVDVRIVPGDHLSIVREPGAADLARVLDTCLAVFDAAPVSAPIATAAD